MTSFLLGIISSAIGWFSVNNQLLKWWTFNHFWSTVLLSALSSIFLYFSVQQSSSSGSTWGIRWLLFGASMITATILAKIANGEEFFSAKNIICLFFALCIVYVQFFFGKN